MAISGKGRAAKRRGPRRHERQAEAGDGMFLSDLAILVGGDTKVGGGLAGAPASWSSFAMAGGVSGVYDSATGRVVGVGYEPVKGLVSAAWGRDEWFDAEYAEMVPPPRIEDLRGDSAGAAKAIGSGPWAMAEGEPERVVRLELAEMKELLGRAFG